MFKHCFQLPVLIITSAKNKLMFVILHLKGLVFPRSQLLLVDIPFLTSGSWLVDVWLGHACFLRLFTGQLFEFVPLDWLKKWLDDSTVTKSIDNTKYLCSHGKLHPDKIADVKRISVKAADLFFSRYGGSPRLDRERCICSNTLGYTRYLTLLCSLNDVTPLNPLLKEDVKHFELLWAAHTRLPACLWKYFCS